MSLAYYATDNSGYNSVQLGTTQFYWVLKQAKTELYELYQVITRYNSFLFGFKTESNGVVLSYTKLYRIVPSYTQNDLVA